MADSFRLGTRGSPLALIQAGMVRDALMSAHGWPDVEIVVIRTTGDRVQDRALAEIGGKALWTRELDHWLAEGRIDAGVTTGYTDGTYRPGATVTRGAMAAFMRDVSSGNKISTLHLFKL